MLEKMLATFLLLDLLLRPRKGWASTDTLVKTSDFCGDGSSNFQKVANVACNNWVLTINMKLNSTTKLIQWCWTWLNFVWSLFLLKLTCPPTPILEAFAKILPVILKVTLNNFPQRNPILVVPQLRRDPKHKPMDDMMMRSPILVIVGLRRNPKHEQMYDAKSRTPMLVVVWSRYDLNHEILDDTKHMNPISVLIGSRCNPNQNPMDKIMYCLDCFARLSKFTCWVWIWSLSKEGGLSIIVPS